MMKARISTRGCLVLFLAAGLCVSGCEREDAAGDALNKAHIQLASLNPAGTPPPTASMKTDAYNKVITTLRPVSDGGTPSQAAAASILISQSQAGIAEPAAARAGEIERSIETQLSSVRSRFLQYLNYSAAAAAQAAYNPAKELADIEASDKKKVEEVKAEQAKKDAIDKQVVDLRNKARAKNDEARALQQQAGALHQQVVNQTATQGEQTLQQSRALARQADALEVEASNLEAEAARTAPQSIAIQNGIERLNKQRDLLAKDRGEVGKRAQAAKDEASRLRAEAAKVADEIKKLVDQIDEVRAGDLKSASEDAIKNYSSAATTPAKAVQEMRMTAQLAIGTARQALGDVFLGRAQGLRAYALVMDSLAKASPALPEADRYKTRAEEAKTATKEAFDAAHQAYQAADAAYGASGGGGEAKARLERLNQKFRDLVKATGGDDALIPARGEPSEAPPPAEATPTTTSAADSSTPEATLAAFLDPAGSSASKAALFYAGNPAEKEAVSSFMTMMEKGKRLGDAVKAKFGGDMSGMGGQFSQMGGGFDPSKLSSLKASDIPVTASGDTAEAQFPGTPKPLKLRKVDGKWQIEFASLVPVPPEQMPMFSAMLAPMGKVMDEMVAEVEAGKYADQQAFSQAFMQKMMQSAMQNAPKPGGG